MKIVRFLVLVSLLLRFAPVLWAQEPVSGLGFTVECQMFIVPTKLVLTLVPDLANDARIASTLPRLLDAVAQGQATLSASLVAKGVLDQRLVAESTTEVKYGTEFEPPTVPDTFFDPNRPGIEEPASLELLKKWPIVGITPTAFETRNVGQMMELEISSTRSAKAFLCKYAIQHVRLDQFVKIDAGRLANGEHLFVEQPYFSNMRDSSTTVLESGKPKLIGVHRLTTVEGNFELFILTLRADAPLEK